MELDYLDSIQHRKTGPLGVLDQTKESPVRETRPLNIRTRGMASATKKRNDLSRNELS